jgi:hypothetical protein
MRFSFKKKRVQASSSRLTGLFGRLWLISPAVLFLLGVAFPAQEWIARIRSTLFVPDPLPPLAAEVHGSFEPEPGVVAERVTYATQFGM